MDKKDTNKPENKAPNKEEFYKKLKTSLDETTEFPADYLFKFIVPTNHFLLNTEKEALKKDKLDEKDKDAIKLIDIKISALNEKLKEEDAKLAKVDSIFDDTNAKIESKKSKSGKYTSKTINVKMKSSDDVIKRYKDAEGVDGIISL